MTRTRRMNTNEVERLLERYWGNISEAENCVLRVITLEDGATVHNVFFDLNFYKRQQRGEEPQRRSSIFLKQTP